MGCLLSREKPPIDSRKTNTLEIEIQSHNNGMGDPEFTEVQKQLVKTTWDVVRDDISKVGVITFLRFVSYIYDFLLLKICFVSLGFFFIIIISLTPYLRYSRVHRARRLFTICMYIYMYLPL